MSLLAEVLLGGAFVRTAAQTADCQPLSAPYPQMGINLHWPNDVPWVNLWHQMQPWWSAYNNGIEFGADGWTTVGRKHRFAADMTPFMCPAGVYKMRWKGTLDQVEWGGVPVRDGATRTDQKGIAAVVQNVKTNFPAPGYCYLEWKCDRAPNDIEFYINGHIEDVKIVRPGFDLNDTRVLHPKYSDVLKSFRALRFMDWVAANNSYVDDPWTGMGPKTVEWSERPNANTPQSYVSIAMDLGKRSKGAAWEYVIEICNELDKDAWINIPLVASDDYLRELAKLFKENLKPSLKVYFEIGNETWNGAGGFDCFRQIGLHFCGTNDWACYRIFNAKTLKHVVDVWSEVWGWGEVNNRIRAVLGGQVDYGVLGDGWSIKPGLYWLENTYG